MKSLLIAVLCALAFAAPALADKGYVELGTGFSGTEFQVDDLNTPTQFSVAVGMVTPTDRFEFQLTHVDIDANNFTTYAGLVNGYHYLSPETDSIRLYVGAGIGAKYFDSRDSELAFAYQLMAGAETRVAEDTVFTYGYQLSDVLDADNHDPEVDHTFKVGLRFEF